MNQLLRPLTILIFIGFGLAGCASSPDVASTRHTARVPADEMVVTDGSDKVERLWQVYERYEGVPYRYGGTTANGFDCSGFILTAYREALGMRLPRTTSQMLASGDYVPRDQLQPGDIVFFKVRGKVRHAGIFMGDERFIHSSTSVGVTHSSLNGYYWRDRFTQARRFD